MNETVTDDEFTATSTATSTIQILTTTFDLTTTSTNHPRSFYDLCYAGMVGCEACKNCTSPSGFTCSCIILKEHGPYGGIKIVPNVSFCDLYCQVMDESPNQIMYSEAHGLPLLTVCSVFMAALFLYTLCIWAETDCKDPCNKAQVVTVKAVYPESPSIVVETPAAGKKKQKTLEEYIEEEDEVASEVSSATSTTFVSSQVSTEISVSNKKKKTKKKKKRSVDEDPEDSKVDVEMDSSTGSTDSNSSRHKSNSDPKVTANVGSLFVEKSSVIGSSVAATVDSQEPASNRLTVESETDPGRSGKPDSVKPGILSRRSVEGKPPDTTTLVPNQEETRKTSVPK